MPYSKPPTTIEEQPGTPTQPQDRTPGRNSQSLNTTSKQPTTTKHQGNQHNNQINHRTDHKERTEQNHKTKHDIETIKKLIREVIKTQRQQPKITKIQNHKTAIQPNTKKSPHRSQMTFAGTFRPNFIGRIPKNTVLQKPIFSN